MNIAAIPNQYSCTFVLNFVMAITANKIVHITLHNVALINRAEGVCTIKHEILAYITIAISVTIIFTIKADGQNILIVVCGINAAIGSVVPWKINIADKSECVLLKSMCDYNSFMVLRY